MLDYDKLIYQLKLLAKLEKYNKLSTTGKTRHRPKLYAIISRAYYGESRDATLDHIEKFCTEIQDYLKNALPNSRINKQALHQKDDQREQLKKLWLELQAATKGLQNLKITYGGDASIENRLDMCIENFNSYVTDIDRHLVPVSTNPLVNSTKIIKTPKSTSPSGARAPNQNSMF